MMSPSGPVAVAGAVNHSNHLGPQSELAASPSFILTRPCLLEFLLDEDYEPLNIQLI